VLRDESDERVIHRLEAFSDIVIGFSLAQLALTLGPVRPSDLFGRLHGLPLVAFVLTFVIVCGMWWSHHQLFTHFFVPKPAIIVLNFATLGSLLFAIYSVQVLILNFGDRTAFAMYTGSFGTVALLLAGQFLYGWNVRKRALPVDVAFRGLGRGLGLLGVGFLFVAAAVVVSRSGVHVRPFTYLSYAIVAYVILMRVFVHWRARRLKQTAGAQA
jgi:uncharacterized membrane protein